MFTFKTLPQLLDYFKDEKFCQAYYEKLRWNGKIICPHCKTEKQPYRTNRGFKCSEPSCYKKFTVRTGSVFESSKIPFRIWFAAIYLLTNHKKGISSVQLASDLGISQKCSWFVLQRVREMLKINAPSMVGGEGKTVETDETYIGGKEKNKHRDKRSVDAEGNYINRKKVVVGLIERNGQVILKHIPAATTENMVGFIRKHAPNGSTIYTDEHKAYRSLGKIYTHETVNHSIKNYANGKVHTNSIENFWSLLKRGLNGVYHQVSEKHLDRYLNEYASRFNTRKLGTKERFEFFLGKSEGRLTYKALVGRK
jgi:transposase-like protein